MIIAKLPTPPTAESLTVLSNMISTVLNTLDLDPGTKAAANAERVIACGIELSKSVTSQVVAAAPPVVVVAAAPPVLLASPVVAAAPPVVVPIRSDGAAVGLGVGLKTSSVSVFSR